MKTRDSFLHKPEINIPGYRSYKDFQYMLWQFFEYPMEFRNVSALVYFVISFSVIVISIANFCVESEIIDDLHGEMLIQYRGILHYLRV